jgi:putative ABC transport system substrate-binding protein
MADFAAELVHLEVSVIVVVGAVAHWAAQKATTTIPIVFAVVIDPAAAGFAATLERPNANLTGMVNSPEPSQARDVGFVPRSIVASCGLPLFGIAARRRLARPRG